MRASTADGEPPPAFLATAVSLPPLPRPTAAAGPRLVVFSGGTAFNSVAGMWWGGGGWVGGGQTRGESRPTPTLAFDPLLF